jgi:uncharacterized protein (TIGR03067 family)
LVNTTTEPFTVLFEDFTLNSQRAAAPSELRIAPGASVPQSFAGGIHSDQDQLQGTWVCVATLLDGKPVDTYVGVRAVSAGDDLTWYFPRRDGTYIEQKNKFRIDPSQQPKHFDWWVTDQPDSVDRRIYAVEGDVLRMATNLDIATRPSTFVSARWQFTIHRIPAPTH